jgi:hypothetical protein
LEVNTSSFNFEAVDEITRVQRQTSRRAIGNTNQPGSPNNVIILDPDHLSALDLEKCAVE